VSADLGRRTGPRLNPDPTRVITKLFVPGEETVRGHSRASAVVARILALGEDEVSALAAGIVADYKGRDRDLAATLEANFDFIALTIPGSGELSPDRRTVIGACFTHEYSVESAALFNPSMAAHPDQSGLAPGQLRFVMTVRCVGEGHISSIGFRTGVLGPADDFVVDEPEPLLVTGSSRPSTYQLRLFHSKLADLGDDRENGELLLGGLPDEFSAAELGEALARVHEHTLNRERVQRAIEHVYRIAAATYELDFPTDTALSQRLLWPTAPSESNGMEDARLVHFTEDDGRSTYYATYTAYDGSSVGTHLLATDDFACFRASPLAGRGAQNKGLALFPRRIGGRYFALSRWDRENLALVDSDDCRIWNEPTMLQTPRHGWEMIQVGNGGSPIEIPQGWLVLTHGVGPMRAYALGAMLLDLEDPSVVLATLPEPLLTPRPDERDGYVPNVVYTCGALLHDGRLTIPYGISDSAIGFAQVELTEVLGRMTSGPQ
jgi:predicted GH43/DUF377 family glycosyl hydrolase